MDLGRGSDEEGGEKGLDVGPLVIRKGGRIAGAEEVLEMDGGGEADLGIGGGGGEETDEGQGEEGSVGGGGEGGFGVPAVLRKRGERVEEPLGEGL